jgi:hypothetical protein
MVENKIMFFEKILIKFFIFLIFFIFLHVIFIVYISSFKFLIKKKFSPLSISNFNKNSFLELFSNLKILKSKIHFVSSEEIINEYELSVPVFEINKFLFFEEGFLVPSCFLKDFDVKKISTKLNFYSISYSKFLEISDFTNSIKKYFYKFQFSLIDDSTFLINTNVNGIVLSMLIWQRIDKLTLETLKMFFNKKLFEQNDKIFHCIDISLIDKNKIIYKTISKKDLYEIF